MSIGTVRTIVTVQGRTTIAITLAIFEIIIWVTVASTVINQISDKPLLVIFLCLRIRHGQRGGDHGGAQACLWNDDIITPNAGPAIASHLRENGQPVTIFRGEGKHGPVNEFYIACRRRGLKWILPAVRCIDPKVFYVIEQARDMSNVYRPICSSLSGWQAISNRK